MAERYALLLPLFGVVTVLAMSILSIPLVSPLAQASLGLVAFSFLMWITMPWAYAEAIEKARVRAKIGKPELLADPMYDKPIEWLDQAHLFYLWSGAIFLVDALAILGSDAFPPANLQGTVYLPYLYEVMFMVGVGFMAFAILRSQQVIAFILHPERLETVAHYEIEVLVATRNISLIVVSLFWAIDLTFGLLYAYASIFTSQTLFIYFQTALFIAGAGGIIPLIISFRRKEVGRSDLFGPILVFIPFASLLLSVLVKSL